MAAAEPSHSAEPSHTPQTPEPSYTMRYRLRDVAVLLVAIALFFLQGPVSALMQTYDGAFRLQGLGISNSFAVLAGAGLLGWLGAWVSVLRHLRAIEPR